MGGEAGEVFPEAGFHFHADGFGIFKGMDESFVGTGSAQSAVQKDMRSLGYIPLGNWHSHPETPSRPSEEDKRLAYDKRASYLILSLMDQEKPVLNSFHIEGTNASREDLVLV